jgi:peptidyl-prolyl cis-trans isomerase C
MRTLVTRLSNRVVGAAGPLGAWVRRHPVIPAPHPTPVVGLALLALLAIGSGTTLALERIEAIPAGAAFRVDGTLVTESQLADRVKLLGALYGVTPPTDSAKLDKFRRDSAKAVVVSDVLADASRAKGIVIADKTANDQLTQLIDTTFPQGRDVFLQKLAGVGVTQEAVLDEVKSQLANARLYDQVTQGVPTPTDQDVEQYYQQHKAEMAVPEKRHLRNIVVADQDQANRIRAQLAGGADFGTAAGQSSMDDSTKGKGGDLGTVTRDQLDKNYGDAAFTVAPNSVFGPVQTQYGWNVGQVLEVTPAVALSLGQAREQLRATMLDQRKKDAWDSWLSGQLHTAHARYADAYRPADPDSATPGPSAGPS